MAVPQEKIELLEKAKLDLDNLTIELRKRKYIYAAAEREYRKALAIKEIELREQKYPANLVYDIARGQLSELMYKRDIAKAEADICEEKLRNEREGINALRSLMAWDRATYLNS